MRAAHSRNGCPAAARAGFTLIEVLIVCAIVLLAVALLLSAVMRVRESANMAKCKNNLRQIGIALLAYHDAQGQFPSGVMVFGQLGNPCPCFGGPPSGPPWTVQILPYLEDSARYNQFNPKGSYFGLYTPPILDPTVYSEMANQVQRNPRFECPSDPVNSLGGPNNNYFGVSGGGGPGDPGVCPSCDGYVPPRYGANNGIFWNGSQVQLGDVVDGTSNTFLVGETRYLQVYGVGAGNPYYGGSWASGYYFGAGPMPISLALTMQPINSSNQDPLVNGTHDVMTTTFGSRHVGGAHFLSCDGAVTFVNQNIDLAVYRSLGRRADGAPTGRWQ